MRFLRDQVMPCSGSCSRKYLCARIPPFYCTTFVLNHDLVLASSFHRQHVMAGEIKAYPQPTGKITCIHPFRYATPGNAVQAISKTASKRRADLGVYSIMVF